MNYRQIEAFHAVMITESMTLAGKMLFISQPAVSRLIIELEDEIGFKLFERKKNKLFPSAEGRLLFEEVEKSFISNYIPTFLKVRGVEQIITHQKQIPSDGKWAYIHFKTDAPDDYTIREFDQGELIVEWNEDILEGTYYGLHNGSRNSELQCQAVVNFNTYIL